MFQGSGISVTITTLVDLGINANLVQNLYFKVKMKGVNDTALHQYMLPAGDLVDAQKAGKVACIHPSDLAQPSNEPPIAPIDRQAWRCDSSRVDMIYLKRTFDKI